QHFLIGEAHDREPFKLEEPIAMAVRGVLLCSEEIGAINRHHKLLNVPHQVDNDSVVHGISLPALVPYATTSPVRRGNVRLQPLLSGDKRVWSTSKRSHPRRGWRWACLTLPVGWNIRD